MCRKTTVTLLGIVKTEGFFSSIIMRTEFSTEALKNYVFSHISPGKEFLNEPKSTNECT